MSSNRIWVRAAIVALVVLGGCSGRSDRASEVPEDELAASVEDWSLTRERLEDVLQHLPEGQRRTFDSPKGRADLAEKLMQEEISYREAKKLNLAKNDNVKEQIEQATRAILVAAYLQQEVDSKARPSDEELHEYYEAHQDMYTELETIRAQHVFSKNKKKLDDIKVRVEEKGEKFTTMAHLYSEDAFTKEDGGDLGYFNPGGYIRGIGFSQTFTDAVVQMEPGKIYGPLKWEQGYSLVRVNEKRPATLRPYEEVREEIATRLAQEKLDNVRTAHFQEVEKNYKTRNFMQESYDKMQRGPEELFNYAQASEDPRQRIAAFQEIVDKFPDDPHAPQALFMVGFVYAEELKDYVSADRSLTQLIEKYPEAEISQTARWMLENLDKPLPKFEDLDDLNRQIEKKQSD